MAFYHSYSSDDDSYSLSMYKELKILDELEYMKWLGWKADFQNVMRCLGLSVALDQEKPNEPTLQDTSLNEEKPNEPTQNPSLTSLVTSLTSLLEKADLARYQKWMRCDELIIDYLKGKLSRDICLRLKLEAGDGANAKQTLDALERLVLEDERRNSIATFQELMDMRYEGEGEVGQHLDRVEVLLQKLRAADIVLPEYFAKKLAFNSLPPEFLRLSFTDSDEKWEWAELRRRCVKFEMILMEIRENEIREQQQQEEIGAKKRRLVQCYCCGKYGHIARNCWHAST
ncbi:hypothetical protein Tsubulata_024879 [Turnera subulata]|uniref:CCHC-type domain-containing protein n=1 Tax=Turnera subulata TaxID=218843 RepID=A0A9Q0FIY0_9ROSI|nr:hypothetical protein Tsubulata_024879 [Turnera subulata]